MKKYSHKNFNDIICSKIEPIQRKKEPELLNQEIRKKANEEGYIFYVDGMEWFYEVLSYLKKRGLTVVEPNIDWGLFEYDILDDLLKENGIKHQMLNHTAGENGVSYLSNLSDSKEEPSDLRNSLVKILNLNEEEIQNFFDDIP